MVNPFLKFVRELTSPAYRVIAITKSDTVDLPGGPCRGILCDSEGTSTIIDASGNQVSNLFIPKGIVPIGVQRVFATNSNSGNMWALY